MKPFPAPLTKRKLMAWVAILIIATSCLIALNREARSQYRRAMAEYERDYARACLRRIPDDIRRAFVCGKWAAEGREAPFGFVDDCQFMGNVNRPQEHRKMVMERSFPGIRGTPDPNFRGWVRESIWWLAESAHDVSRAAWHASMSKKYECAAFSPMGSLPPVPPEQFPDA
jgi:hypothetical protein